MAEHAAQKRKELAGLISHSSAGSGPLSFTVETKSGRTLEYGGSADARLGVPAASEVRLWSLNQVADTLGNAMTYHYVEDTNDSSYRLDRIEYAANTAESVTPQSEVRFVYEARPDTRTSYLAGAKLAMTQRLATVETWTDSGSGLALVKRYTLTYETSPATSRTRLTAVTECDASNNCLQPVQLGWQASAAGGWLNDPGYSLPDVIDDVPRNLRRGEFHDVNGDGLVDWVRGFREQGGTIYHKTWLNTGSGWQHDATFTIPDHGFYDAAQGVRHGDFVDLNGDGLVDWVRAFVTPWDDLGKYTFLNTGAGWVEDPAYALPDIIYNANGTTDPADNYKQGEFADVNGDGLPDWVLGHRDPGGMIHHATWLNTGTGWEENANYTIPDHGFYDAAQGVRRGDFIDLNGDGLVDWVRALRTPFDTVGIATFLNTGSGWQEAPTYALPDIIYNANGTTDPADNFKQGEFVDVNGDGLPDWVLGYRDPGGTIHHTTWINTGTGWQEDANYAIPDHGFYDAAQGVRHGDFVDVNGDGLVDWVRAFATPWGDLSKHTYLNTGAGWVEDPAYTLPDIIYHSNGTTDPTDNFIRGELADVNGDGLADWVRAYRNSAGTSVMSTALNGAPASDLLTSITDSLGRVSTIAYAPLTDATAYSKDSDAVFPVVDIQAPLYVVKSVSSDDGVGGQKVTSYTYAGAKVHVQGRGFRGFRQMTATDQQTGIVTTTDYSQVFPTTAQVLTSAKTLSDGTTVKTIANTWDALSLNNGDTVWPYVATSVSEDYEPGDGVGNSPIVSRTATAVFDGYGNPTSLTTTTSGGGESFTETTVNTYVNDTANWHLGLVTRSEVTRTRPGAP